MRAYQLVLEWVEKQLFDGELAIGGRLPGERALAEHLSVSRTSVREAFRVLEAMGVIKAGVGSGKDAGTVVIANPATALGSALRLHVATQHLSIADIVETRVLLESWAALHAKHGVPALEEAAQLLAEMASVAAKGEADVNVFLALDVRFHLALATAAGNAVVSAMMGSLREAIEGYTAELAHNLPDWKSTVLRLCAEHQAIFDTIIDGDGSKAAGLIGAHIQGYYREAGFQNGAEIKTCFYP
ncbi:FadR/GntR family transcriptional regulator [Arthrobacter sulfonylureivorans]|uniref:FCD domain-containing protein n=1 Tax=Arthrobacter sulfonylureivorans TaxID=2486855 RepID=A0ABY3WFA3_9MICC|nr:FCD domain-containing protein [Arthrobacter sulfonylureivorans]UNK47868.1 FCD domain-containing protein [Arthrobacter sulfonylureivorans]